VAVGRAPTDDEIVMHGKGVFSILLTGANMKRLPDYHGLEVTWLFLQTAPQVNDLAPLAGLPLRGLSIDGEHGIASLAPLAPCKELRYLSVVNGSKVSDLSPLQGLPLTRLLLDGSLVSDLAPLSCLPLRLLSLSSSKVLDLSPLAGMTELRDLAISSTKVADLRPLKKLRLERLIAGTSAVNDITALAGLPLRVVQLEGTAVRDLSPLLECPDLEEATVPRDAKNVEVLRNHPKLRRLSYEYDATYGGPARTVAEFWKEYEASHPAAPK